MHVEHLILEMALAARRSSRAVAVASTKQKNQVIEIVADQFEEHSKAILEANHVDMAEAQKKCIPQPPQDRLLLTENGIKRMCKAARAVAILPGPVGTFTDVAW